MPKRKASELGLPVQSLAEPIPEDFDEDEEPASDSDGDGSGGSSAPEVSSSEEDDDDDDDDEDNQLTSNFNARAPEEADFHGLKKLLANYLNGRDYHNSELVDTIIGQQSVGMLITSGEDEADDPAQAAGSSGAGPDADQGSIWAVFTALSIEHHKAKTFMSEIKDFAIACCRDSQAAQEQLCAAWDARGTGLLVSECVLGLHPKLAPLSLRALLDDIRRATTDEPTSKLRESFKFEQLVLLPLVLVETSAVRALPKGQSVAGLGTQHIFYMRPEHEYIHRHCSWSHIASCDKPPRNDGFLEFRLVMAVAADKLALVQRDLDAEIRDAA
jgi:protein BCP1